MVAPVFHRAVIVVLVVLAGVGIVVGLLGGWDALTAVGTFLAIVVALVLAVWGDDLRRMGRSPILSLTTLPVPDHFQKFRHPGGTTECDVRISVMNQGNVGAQNVELIATEMTVKQANGSFARDPVFMAMNLTRTHYDDTVTPMVHRGVPRPYDLLRCLDPDLQRNARRKELMIDFSTVVPPVAAKPIDIDPSLPEAYPSSKTAGTYRLTLAVVADSVAPARYVVEVVWSGKWTEDPLAFFGNELTVNLRAD